MRRTFEVVPPDARMAWLLPAIGLAIALLGIAFAAREEPRAWFLLAPIGLAGGAIAWSLQRRAVWIEDGALRIAAGLNSATVALDALDMEAARIVDLDREPGLRPLFKTFGTSMPGYQAGHFRLRDRSRAFLLLTSRRKVLVLHEQNGRRLLLSLTRPQPLLDAIGEAAPYRRG